MGSAVIPSWVARPDAEVIDCHRIAYAVAAETLGLAAAGASAAFGWVTGGCPGPITGRTEIPAAAAARAEMMQAFGVVSGITPPDPVIASLGVDPAPVLPDVGADWAGGVQAALGWMLGVHSRPPYQIPRRRPDGSLPSAEDLYEEAVAARPHALWEPEQRIAARRQAEQDAALYRRLADIAASAA